ncbi:MAG: xanthine dehydrogenase family protein molybdopterin-binding subunit [Deltaproteobacteria bacterium]|nr:MAG: xanthine dehydrogenase family protein molybdopterin-binding subunit [Deltaproteobacteria bacterium]
MRDITLSRRQFLKGTGALIVSFSVARPVGKVLAQSNRLPSGELDPTALDSWLAIGQDGSVTVFTSKVDLGTGVETALAQIVAEELDIPFKRIKMEVGDTTKTIDQASTVGSRTIERGGPQLRQAAAAARQALLKLASERLGASVEQLTVTDGVVSAIGNSSNKVSYGQLIGGKRFNVTVTATGTGWDMKVAPEIKAKDPKDYKIVGTSVPRVELPPKLTGEFTYTQDFRVPGMLHGRVVRPPLVNSKPTNIDESSVKNIPGLIKVVQDGNFVGVVAKTEWAAIQAAKALKVTWSEPSTKMPANADALFAHIKDTKSFRDQVAVNKGNPDTALSQASKKYEATYRWPFQLHGALGPSCAVADVRKDRATVWTGTQGPFRTRGAVAQLLGLKEQQVRVIYVEGSGCYGRFSTDDAPEDAAVMSRAVGKPVRVQWMREDEHAWEPKGPAQLEMVRAGVDAQGKITAWDFMDRGFPWTEAQGMPLLASRQVGIKPTGQGNSNGTQGGGEIYAIENQKCVSALIPWVWPDPIPLRTSNLRAPGDLARSFASEGFMDEIASDLGVDPVQFRLRYLTNNKRATEALLAATKKAGWQERPSPAPAATGSKASGRGVALSNRAGTLCGAVAEVEVDKSSGNVTVKKITIAHDCGLIVNPDGLKNQIEGNVIQGASRALMEEVQFDASGVKNNDWSSYPIIAFPDVPDVDIVLINRPETPALGGGEPSIVPVAAAIGNAIFDAIGVRLREVPFTPERVLTALKAPPVASQRA